MGLLRINRSDKSKLRALLARFSPFAESRADTDDIWDSDRLVYYELTDILGPGALTAVGGKKLLFDGTANSGDGEYSLDTETVTNLRCPLGNCWGLKGDRVGIRPLGSDNGVFLEIVTPGAPWYEMSLSGGLAAGGTASATCTIRGQTNTVTVTDRLLRTGDSLASGARVMVFPDVHNTRWTVLETPCPSS